MAKWKRGSYIGDRTSWVRVKNRKYSQIVGREELSRNVLQSGGLAERSPNNFMPGGTRHAFALIESRRAFSVASLMVSAFLSNSRA